jgi:hypothetical protein
MSGRKSRDKGNRFERACVPAFVAFGLNCRRMPLSGALGGEFAGDIRAAIDGESRVFQLKCLANGWRTVYSALAGHDGLIIRADRSDPLVVLPLAYFLKLCGPKE